MTRPFLSYYVYSQKSKESTIMQHPGYAPLMNPFWVLEGYLIFPLILSMAVSMKN